MVYYTKKAHLCKTGKNNNECVWMTVREKERKKPLMGLFPHALFNIPINLAPFTEAQAVSKSITVAVALVYGSSQQTRVIFHKTVHHIFDTNLNTI